MLLKLDHSWDWMVKRKKPTHKIQSIQSQKRYKNRFTITLESGDVFGISEDVLISNNLRTGQDLSLSQINHIQQEEIKVKIKNSAILLLSYRMRSKAELEERLLKKNYDKILVSTVISDLESSGYINDNEFCEMYANHLIKNKLLGPMAVRSHFLKHKISEDILNETMNKLYDKMNIENIIETNIQKRIRGKSLTDKEKLKTIQFLKRKGFFWHDIEPVIQSIPWESA